MTVHTPTKDLTKSINLVQDLQLTRMYSVKLTGHYLDDNILEIKKEGKEYTFSGSSKIQKGLQTHKEIEFSREDLIRIKDKDYTLFISGKHIFVNKIEYDMNNYEKLFSGSINSFSSSENHSNFNNKRLRMIIPNLNETDFTLHDFKQYIFYTNNKESGGFLPITFEDTEYHLYRFTSNKINFLIIDCINEETITNFQKKCFALLLSYGFVTGKLIHDECFILSFSDENMIAPLDLIFHSMRSSILTSQPIFTSNPFSIYTDTDFERESDGQINKSVSEKLNEGMDFFPITVFNELSRLFYKEEKLQRAALLFIQSHNTSLEMRIPNYFVAIEAITSFISSSIASGSKTLAPIKDSHLARNLINEFIKKAHELKKEKDLGDEEFNLDILLKNINRLNAPPNADKLAESFLCIGYDLSNEEKNVLKDRNIFLHGSFLKTIEDDGAFREALHVALRINFLIAAAILKIAGFSGKIINYAQLWSGITEKPIFEERLIKI